MLKEVHVDLLVVLMGSLSSVPVLALLHIGDCVHCFMGEGIFLYVLGREEHLNWHSGK